MHLARQRRAALCDAALTAGPTSPTLCTGWDVRDLLVHLIVRDSRPDAMVAASVPGLRSHAERVQARLAELDFDDLVHRVRCGPPRLSPLALRPVDDLANTVEFVVHHVDIVRAVPAGDASEHGARPLFDDQTQEAILTDVRRMGRLFLRSAPVGVVVVAPGRGRAALRRPPRGRGTVVLTGDPVELVTYLSGRGEHADVQVSGGDDDIAAWAATSLGF